MSSNATIAQVQRFFAGTGPSYDRIVNLLTFGADRYWKRKILAAVPPKPALIIDQACGTGILSIQLARQWPQCRVIGVELRREYLDIARSKAQALGLGNLRWVQGRAECVRLDVPADCITSSYLAKYADRPSLVANARRMLRPGGRMILHDFTHPRHPGFCRLWHLYLRLLQTAGSRIWPQWRVVFRELPELLETTAWVSETADLLRTAGFARLRFVPLTFHTSVMLTADRPLSPIRR